MYPYTRSRNTILAIFPIGAYSAARALPSRLENVGEAKSGSQPLTVGENRSSETTSQGGVRSDLSGGEAGGCILKVSAKVGKRSK